MRIEILAAAGNFGCVTTRNILFYEVLTAASMKWAVS
jgi:hypothetical protein